MSNKSSLLENHKTEFLRRLPFGAEVLPQGGVHFRVWAPRRKKVEVVIEGGMGFKEQQEAFALLRENKEGYFSGMVEGAGEGSIYRFRLDGGEMLYPDPASRFQPDGPHGPSRVVDPGKFKWTDREWRGVTPKKQVIYEMHIGTFTRDGGWSSAGEELPELANIGITVLEIMPVCDFPGRFGWGYDGVNLFAPCRLYGEPD
ncbi:MAG: malto-oligosyltrehalose trehalohydrolase, partial [Candidatus Latescibacterota bacterium]